MHSTGPVQNSGAADGLILALQARGEENQSDAGRQAHG
jgi:hypothetical protein